AIDVSAVDLKSHGSRLLRGAQRAVEVFGDVARGLQADRQPHQFLAQPRFFQLLGIHLLMRRARGVNDQRLGVADIGKMTREPERLDEFPPRLAPALYSATPDRP